MPPAQTPRLESPRNSGATATPTSQIEYGEGGYNSHMSAASGSEKERSGKYLHIYIQYLSTNNTYTYTCTYEIHLSWEETLC